MWVRAHRRNSQVFRPATEAQGSSGNLSPDTALLAYVSPHKIFGQPECAASVIETNADRRKRRAHDILVMTAPRALAHHQSMQGLDGDAFTARCLADILSGGGPGDANILWKLVVANLSNLGHVDGMSVGPDATCGSRRLYRAECIRWEPRTGPASVDQVEKLLLIGIRRGRWAWGGSRNIRVRRDLNALYVQSEAREWPSIAVGKGDIDNVSSRAGDDVAQCIGRIRRCCDRDRADRHSVQGDPGLRDEQAPTGIAWATMPIS